MADDLDNSAEDTSSSDDEEYDSETSEEEEEEDEQEQKDTALLWLCQEDQMALARKRLEQLLQEHKIEQLKREVFEQDSHDGTHVLQEVMMRASSLRPDDNAMIRQLLEFCRKYPQEYSQALLTQPRSFESRIPLHWAAANNLDTQSVITPLVMACPEALFVEDDRGRTPVDLCVQRQPTKNPQIENNRQVLEQCMLRWKRYCVQREVHKCVVRCFVTQELEPSCERHRKKGAGNMKLQDWNTLSILGFFENRDKQLVCKILSYVGCDTNKVTKKRKRK
jgi:hypothetical protein